MLKRIALLLFVVALAAPSASMAACHAPEPQEAHAMAIEHGDGHPSEMPDGFDGTAVGCIGCSIPPGRAIESGGVPQPPIATIAASAVAIPESRLTTPDTPPPRP